MEWWLSGVKQNRRLGEKNMCKETQVLVIGGGVGGIMAAIELAKRHIQVTLVEELPYLGGKTAYQTQRISSLSIGEELRGFELVERLIQQLDQYDVEIMLDHGVIGLYENRDVSVIHKGKIIRIKAENIIIATGAAEKSVVFDGWTLPGVMTIEAAQQFINRDFVRPGNRAVIYGISSFTAGVVELFDKTSIKVEAILTSDDASSKNLSFDSIPVLSVQEVTALSKENKVDLLAVALCNGQLLEIETDFVCTDGGRSPVLETLAIFDCDIEYSEKLQSFVPRYDERMETSVENVFVAGASAGLKSYDVILASAEVAAAAIAEKIKIKG